VPTFALPEKTKVVRRSLIVCVEIMAKALASTMDTHVHSFTIPHTRSVMVKMPMGDYAGK